MRSAYLILVAGLALCLAGCGSDQPTNGDNNDQNNGDNNNTPAPTILSGKVTEAGGASAPVAGAQVVLATASAQAGAAGTSQVSTRDDGTFQFDDPFTGDLELRVTPPSGSGLQPATISASAVRERTSEVVVRLLPTGTTVTSITLTPDSMTVSSGRRVQFTATVTTSDGSTVHPTWSVTGGVGLVNATGLFTAAEAGTGQVRATLGDRVAAATVTVVGCILEVRDEQDQNPSGQECNVATRARALAVDGRAPLIIAYAGDRAHCQALIESLGGRVDDELPLMSALVAEVPVSALALLQADAGIRYVSVDSPVSIRQAGSGELLPWGVDKVDAERAWGGSNGATSIAEDGITGRGVKVAVIDTGIDADHVDLVVAGGANILNPAADSIDDNGHGTRVAGIIGARANGHGIIGVAPECDLFAVKVLDMRGQGTIADVVKGIEWCIANGMNIINMSLGVTNCETILKEACDTAYADGQGILVFGAAGNRGQDAWTAWPGNFASVVSVGGTDRRDEVATFSVAGAAVEIAAPGEQIFTTDLGNSYASEDGTSFSVPHAAGVAALVWSTGRYSSAERVRQHLRDTAVDLGPAGRDQQSGYGRLDAYTAVTDLSCSDR